VPHSTRTLTTAAGGGGRCLTREAIARVDYPAWREGLTQTQQEIADDLTTGGLNSAGVGRKRGVTRTRIWQHREKMRQDHDKIEAGERER
jgi:hypothetical protein